MSIQTKQKMVEWVKKNIADCPTLHDMALHVGYSPYYCSTKFHEHTGITYKQFLSKCRIKAAADDLVKTDDRVTDIAFRYGYSSSESLTRAFLVTYKCSPRQYRNQHRQLPPD